MNQVTNLLDRSQALLDRNSELQEDCRACSRNLDKLSDEIEELKRDLRKNQLEFEKKAREIGNALNNFPM